MQVSCLEPVKSCHQDVYKSAQSQCRVHSEPKVLERQQRAFLGFGCHKVGWLAIFDGHVQRLGALLYNNQRGH